jgi:predicted GNAT family acetyltransferase
VADLPEVHHNAAAQRFEVTQNGHQAELGYTLAGNSIVFTHTEVPAALEGRGIGSALARTALDYATAEKLDIVALCPFVYGYLEKHPEYKPAAKGTSGGGWG